ncbi:hypothetical protein GBF38_001302 [Nibea albiflora]|uniref:Uncharacterized protein n=1 Tax=Nibea albiflora TaxID=240163 RepID=A0ACB7EUW7_NIBAL|nr:hypothetical protein GBF38_001302 [Nibea albiflora]
MLLFWHDTGSASRQHPCNPRPVMSRCHDQVLPYVTDRWTEEGADCPAAASRYRQPIDTDGATFRILLVNMFHAYEIKVLRSGVHCCCQDASVVDAFVELQDESHSLHPSTPALQTTPHGQKYADAETFHRRVICCKLLQRERKAS